VSRSDTIGNIEGYFDDDAFYADLVRHVAICTESPIPIRRPELYSYLNDKMTPRHDAIGLTCETFENLRPDDGALLVAHRHEADDLPTVKTYGHGDVVRGYDEQWRDGLDPWLITEEGDLWYWRGTADNKGQHTITLAAMNAVLDVQEHVGFNVVELIKTGKKYGSSGLKEFCASHKELFKADVFIASDGPCLQPDTPRVLMSSRGVFNFTMSLNLREDGYNSGNWSSLLANFGVIMAHALASIVDAKLHGSGGGGAPEIDRDWGEPNMISEEKVFGSNTFEINAFETGNPRNQVNAIPPRAVAYGHLHYVVGTDPETIQPSLSIHLDAYGFEAIELGAEREFMYATRLDPDHPWACKAVNSIKTTAAPNVVGTLPNDVFADVLDLQTILVPHLRRMFATRPELACAKVGLP